MAAPAVMPSAIAVTADKGLKEIRIYNGQNLFRRFILKGTNAWHQTLVLEGTVQKNLVLVAEDMAGGKAVSYARRCWKDGALAPVFCSDHVNDGGHNYLTHGPNQYQFNFPPSFDANIAGDTWDGGPRGSRPLGYQDAVCYLETDKGNQEGGRFNQTPLLEFSDEGAVAVRSERKIVFADHVLRVCNAWNSWGPLAGPSKFFEHNVSYREWVTPTIDVPHYGWAGPGVRVGANPSLFINDLTFKSDLKIKLWRWGMIGRKPEVFLVLGTGPELQVIDIGQPIYTNYPVKQGDWFGLFSKNAANSHLFINRGEPFQLQLGAALILQGEVQGKDVKTGDRSRFEMCSVGFPIDVEIKSAEDLKRYVDYIAQPEGLLVVQGKKVASPGVVEFVPVNHAVEFFLPRPIKRLDLTLPVMVTGLNTRWTAILWQKKGYSKGHYGAGENRYRALGLDLGGNAYIPVYVDYAAATWMTAGHPVVSGPEGKDLFIQVTRVNDQPDQWHVSVNNPTDQVIATTLRKVMDLPGLILPDTPLTVQPGEYKVIL